LSVYEKTKTKSSLFQGSEIHSSGFLDDSRQSRSFNRELIDAAAELDENGISGKYQRASGTVAGLTLRNHKTSMRVHRAQDMLVKLGY